MKSRLFQPSRVARCLRQASLLRTGRAPAACLVAASLLAGCGPGSTSQLASTNIDPEQVADAALAQYDTNGDGVLDMQELTACPAIEGALKTYDTNADQKVDRQELGARFARLFTSGVGMTTVNCTIKSSGRPLPGVTVRMVPEAFLGPAIRTAVGETSMSGVAIMAIPAEELPTDLRDLRVMQAGVYRVEVDAGKPELASQTLGCEIDLTDRNGTNPEFDLSRK